MSNLSYRVCTRCVMDTTDPDIVFDADGVCNHCHEHLHAIATQVHSGQDGRGRLEAMAEDLKRRYRDKPYDCIIGVSGGVDSSYVAWLVKDLGLRPLAVHLDNGWNSVIAVRNIANMIEALDIDLYTHVIDWEEYKDIQRAFLKASLPDVEVPTDHAINTIMFKVAAKFGVRTVLRGGNVVTESHHPARWSQGHLDYGYISDVHRKFGSGKVDTFPHLNFPQFLKMFRGGFVETIDILNFADYSREKALARIETDLGWEDYGGKHHESVFTRWFQGVYLLRKFDFDKRKMHLSSLISTGEITRDQARAKLQQPTYDEALQEEDNDFVAKKLGFTRAELDAIMAAPPAHFEDFDSWTRRLDGPAFGMVKRVYRMVRGKAQPPSASS
ncbi:N-acetyl sugar amidotransferase [Sphingomonas sp. G-3-2-10]|uniref:N-acetyl sugar amidotransferase n=1 Tax=Sphingomonas sp. G-3-2-10 TaxID=2728838 RepID=UPI00146A5A8E|nr:N-acetyl sugar amidotransferase [Sphingomonas sp. G-3-2-10]NML06235.1 N-acetyl sugar amidotransferase [Sphingomonas sp. G-3-2-10]